MATNGLAHKNYGLNEKIKLKNKKIKAWQKTSKTKSAQNNRHNGKKKCKKLANQNSQLPGPYYNCIND